MTESTSAEILDVHGNVLPGFGRDDRAPFHGDTGYELRWKTTAWAGKDELSKIRFILKNADLFPYRVEAE